MSQEFQMIGRAAPELEAVAAEQQGREGQTVGPQAEEVTGNPDFSFRARRANLQALGWRSPAGDGIPCMAGYGEGNFADRQPEPWDPYRP